MVSCLQHALLQLNFVQVGILFRQVLRPLSPDWLNVEHPSTLLRILSVLGVLIYRPDVVPKSRLALTSLRLHAHCIQRLLVYGVYRIIDFIQAIDALWSCLRASTSDLLASSFDLWGYRSGTLSQSLVSGGNYVLWDTWGIVVLRDCDRIHAVEVLPRIGFDPWIHSSLAGVNIFSLGHWGDYFRGLVNLGLPLSALTGSVILLYLVHEFFLVSNYSHWVILIVNILLSATLGSHVPPVQLSYSLNVIVELSAWIRWNTLLFCSGSAPLCSLLQSLVWFANMSNRLRQ